MKYNIEDITVAMLKNWFLDKIKEHSLTNRKYKEMKSLLNMLYDFAIESNIYNYNTSRAIHNISRKKFAVERKKTPEEQVYMNDEEANIIKLALKQYEKTHNTAYLAVCLNYTLALRVGELVALKVSDFTESTVHIQRQEIKNYEQSEDGTIRRNGYTVTPYLKSVDSDRELYLVDEARMLFGMIVNANREHGFESEYLFLDKNGNRMNNDAVNNVLRRINRMIGTVQKGNHSIRKTCISNMGASKLLTDEEIRAFAGHKDFTTTMKHYIHAVDSVETRKEAYEQAIGSKISVVFKSVQNVSQIKKEETHVK